eukprot:scaffold191578_cov20-Tisochrysis_lutea.AAC.1
MQQHQFSGASDMHAMAWSKQNSTSQAVEHDGESCRATFELHTLHASTIGRYPVQRHKFPSRASRNSIAFGLVPPPSPAGEEVFTIIIPALFMYQICSRKCGTFALSKQTFIPVPAALAAPALAKAVWHAMAMPGVQKPLHTSPHASARRTPFDGVRLANKISVHMTSRLQLLTHGSIVALHRCVKAFPSA